MKKYLTRMIMLLVFSSVAISGCSVEYRQHRRDARNHDHDHDGHYDNYNHH